MDEVKARALLAREPYALHVSLDSLEPTVYKAIRGVDRGVVVKTNIAGLIRVARREGSRTFIGIKTVVTEANHAELVGLVQFARVSGADGIHFQPVLVHADVPGSSRLLPKASKRLDESVKALADAIPVYGRYVVNTLGNIRAWSAYFSGVAPKRRFCSTSMQNLFISADGTVRLCERYEESIGNILQWKTISGLVASPEAVRQRAMMTRCQRHCSFIFSRGIRDYVAIAWRHLSPAGGARGRRRKAAGSSAAEALRHTSARKIVGAYRGGRVAVDNAEASAGSAGGAAEGTGDGAQEPVAPFPRPSSIKRTSLEFGSGTAFA